MASEDGRVIGAATARRGRLTEVAYQHLRDVILRGALPVGSVLAESESALSVAVMVAWPADLPVTTPLEASTAAMSVWSEAKVSPDTAWVCPIASMPEVARLYEPLTGRVMEERCCLSVASS
jgi:predicted aconitase with swiveling domain